MTSDLKPVEVIKEIKRQLDWRGPSGKPQGHIVLTREQAEALLTPTLMNNAIDQAFEELIELTQGPNPVSANAVTLHLPNGRPLTAGDLEPGQVVKFDPTTGETQPLVHLTSKELDLLQWLQAEQVSQYGECYGGTLDSLIAKGLVEVHGPGEIMHRAVALTEAGLKLLET